MKKENAQIGQRVQFKHKPEDQPNLKFGTICRVQTCFDHCAEVEWDHEILGCEGKYLLHNFEDLELINFTKNNLFNLIRSLFENKKVFDTEIELFEHGKIEIIVRDYSETDIENVSSLSMLKELSHLLKTENIRFHCLSNQYVDLVTFVCADCGIVSDLSKS